MIPCSSPTASACACALSPIHLHSIIMWWLASPPSRGCYLLSQIFARQSEARIGIRSQKGVDWHHFYVTCIKFELERSFEPAFFQNTLIRLFKLKYTCNKICRLWLSSTVVRYCTQAWRAELVLPYHATHKLA